MELLGDRNWWLRRWLQRFLPHLDIEGAAAPATEPNASDDDRSAPKQPSLVRLLADI
jgi:hypothetical protein